MILRPSLVNSQRAACWMTWPLFGLRNHRWVSSTAKPPALVLYQYAICPFCHQSKAFLDYYRTPYETIEVNPLTKAEIKPFRETHNYKQVPIATLSVGADGTQPLPLLGSDEIIRHVLQSSATENATKTNEDNTDEAKWSTYARTELAVLLYPNLCRTLSSSYAAFDYVHKVESSFSWFQKMSMQLIGSLAMFMAASRVKKKYNIVDEEAALIQAIDKLEGALSSSQTQYLTPTTEQPQRPGTGDLIVFGTIRSLEVASPTLHTSVVNSRPAVARWYQSMTEQVTNGI